MYTINCKQNKVPLCDIKKIDENDYFNADEIRSFNDICDQQHNWLIADENIGEKSFSATVRPSYCSSNKSKKYIFKIVSFKSDIYAKDKVKKDFDKEIEMQNLASNYGVTSPVYQVFKNNNFGLFVMDLYQITVFRFFLEELKKSDPDYGLLESIFIRCLEILNLLKENNILHTDIHLNNFMLENIENKEIKIIDFGICVQGVPDKDLNTDNSLTLVLELSNIFRETQEKYYDFLSSLADIADKRFGYDQVSEKFSLNIQTGSRDDIFLQLKKKSKELDNFNFKKFEFLNYFLNDDNDDNIPIVKERVFKYIIQINKFKRKDKYKIIDIIAISKKLAKLKFENDELFDYYVELEDYLEDGDKDPRETKKLIKMIKIIIFNYLINVCELNFPKDESIFTKLLEKAKGSPNKKK